MFFPPGWKPRRYGRLNVVGGRLPGGAVAGLMFVMAGEVAGRFVTQAVRRFLDAGTIAQQLYGQSQPLFVQPRLEVLSRFPKAKPVQGTHGDPALPRQDGSRPLGLPGEFPPVFYMLQFYHKHPCRIFLLI
jgi:hypothetical protein